MIDVISGQIQFYFETMPLALQHIRNDNVRALAVTSRQRSSYLPNVPTIAESGVIGYDASSWYGLVAPSNTPRTVMTRLNQAMTRYLSFGYEGGSLRPVKRFSTY
jgi:tripartite-type tricarboxylate transporter receptor subunit TctC